MLHFLFATWFGGVVCCFVALLFAGIPIVNWINKKKQQAIAETKHWQERYHSHTNQQTNHQNPR